MKKFWIQPLVNAISAIDEWSSYIDLNVVTPPPRVSVHLGVFVEPYLSFIFDGTKTVESRFSINRCAPFGVANEGDVLLLKQAAGPVVGLCRIATVWSYRVTPETMGELQLRFEDAMCALDPTFWTERSKAGYATLMQIHRVSRIVPFEIEKRDRRGWVVITKRSKQLRLWDE